MKSNVLLLREPKQSRTKALVERICDATVSIAQESGPLALNTNAIAERAEVDVSSLYRFFPNKTAILQYIFASWLTEVRSVWDKYENDQALLLLEWDEYFSGISDEWQLSDKTQDYFRLFQDACALHPELTAMDLQHRENFIAFYSRQFKRFGAKGTKRQWRDLAAYLYIIEDEVHAQSARGCFSSLDAGRAFYLHTLRSLLSEIMP